MVWIVAVHTLQDNHANTFAVSDTVDLETGAHKVVAVVRVTSPGEWVMWPDDDEAAELIAAGAARLPTPAELQLRQLHAEA